jgi:putative colanic acid biosynthesis glycosyltransferase
MTHHPLITIITVVFNGHESLEKTIQSVLGQSNQSIEYIIIDGGSTDGSVDIIKKYNAGINYWVSEKDRGIYHAMNKGINLAKGQWCCFLNSGDVLVNSTIIQQVADAIQAFSQPDILYGNILVKTAGGGLIERLAKEPANSHRMYFCHQSAFVKTLLLRQYLFDETHLMSADFKFFKQCFYDHRTFIHLSVPLVIYDVSGISNTQRNRGLRDNIAVVKEMDSFRNKVFFLLRLYFVIGWRILTGKK